MPGAPDVVGPARAAAVLGSQQAWEARLSDPPLPPPSAATAPRHEFVLEELDGGGGAHGSPPRAPYTGGGSAADYGYLAEAPPAAGAPTSGMRGTAPQIDREMLPEVLAGTLDHIVGQLDIITGTLAILEQARPLVRAR